MDKPEILLINLNQRDRESEVKRLLDRHCRLTCLSEVDAIAETIQMLTPQVICFEYDYPDIPRLTVLQETKLEFHSLPIVMVTKQHSEELAVWAFRSRVWDYFTKPLPIAEVLACFRTIQELPRKQQQNAPRAFVLRQCALPTDTRFQSSSRSRDARVVDTAIIQVERNLHNIISQSDIAKSCGMTSSQFSRVFKLTHGTTFQEYVLRRRISQAIRLLQNPSASVTDICYTVGFNDQSYFTRTFRRYIGTSPTTYRNNLKTAHASLPQIAQL
ncbi:MAG: response regulator transcription factor [Gammaproteobacteria bacterium]|jgi:AraC-like DNA-binding protein